MTQERANAMAEAFDNRPMAQLQKLRNERDAMDRGPDGKLSRKDRKRWNEIGAEIHAIQSQIIASRGGTTTPTQTPVTEKKKGGGLFGGLKRVVGGTADQLTGNLFDFDKKSGGGLIRKTAGAVGGLFGGDKKEGGTKGSSGILGPISSNVDGMVNRDKYEVQPKEKKNTVVAYEQAVNEQQQQDQEASSDGNEIPNFSIRPSFMIDEAKVDVLGIMI